MKNPKEKKTDDKATEKKKEVTPKKGLALTLRDAISRACVRVCTTGTLQYFLPDLGIKFVLVEDWTEPKPDGHPVTHVARDDAIRTILADAEQYALEQRLVVADEFGRGHQGLLPHCAEGVGVEFAVRRGLSGKPIEEYAGDAARAKPGSPVASSLPDVCMYVDIYQGRKELDQEKITRGTLQPRQVAQAAAGTRQGVGYIVVHDLRELVGAEIFKAKGPGELGSIKSCEGSWTSTFVGGQRMISYQPDRHTVPYPLHPVDQSWLVSGAINLAEPVLGLSGQRYLSMHVHQMAYSGPFRIFKVVLRTEIPLPVNPTLLSKPRYLSLPLNGLLAAFSEAVTGPFLEGVSELTQALTGQVTLPVDSSGKPVLRDPTGFVAIDGYVLIDTAAGQEGASDVAFTKVNGRTLASAYMTVESQVRTSAFGAVSARYPGHLSALAINSTLWALLQRRDIGALERLAVDHEGRSAAVDEFVKTGTPSPRRASLILKGLLGLGSVAIVYAMWKRWKTSVAGPMGLLRLVSAQYESMQVPKAIQSTLLGAWTGDGVAPWVSTISRWLGPVTQHTPEWLMNMVRGSDSAMHAMVCSSGHLVQIFGEEVFKYIFGVKGAVAISIFEALVPLKLLYAGQVTASDLLSVRGPATVMHLLTGMAYSTLGLKSLPVCLLGHQLFNMAVSIYNFSDKRYLAMRPCLPRLPASMLKTECDKLIGDWALRWATATQTPGSEPQCVVPCSGYKMRAFSAIELPADVPEDSDWRASSLKVTVDGVVLDRSQWEELKLPASDHNHFVPCGSLEATSLPETLFSYPLMITSGQLYQPSKDGHTLVASLVHRDFNDPFGFYATPLVEHDSMELLTRRLAPVKEWMVENTKRRFTSVAATHEECARELGGFKGQQYTRAAIQVDNYGYPHRTQAQSKNNENIKCSCVVGGYVALKPRTVKNVSTDDQTGILPLARALAKDAKKIFNGEEVFEVGRFRVRFIIAESNQQALDSYGDLHAHSSDMVITVSCDDTVATMGRYKPYFGYHTDTSDYGQYDQSQSEPFFKIDFAAISSGRAELHGLEQAFVDLHDRINRMPVQGKVKDPALERIVRVIALIRYSMRTGVGTTSSFGSLHNIYLRVYWLLRCQEEHVSFVTTCAELGVVVKLATQPEFNGAVFLRGWFLGPTYTWSVLPSCCLKLGKVMKDPRVLLKTPDEKLAAATMFHAVMQSVHVPDDYPILGSMKQLSQRLERASGDRAAKLIGDAYIFENARHKVLSGAATRRIVLDAMAERYGVSEEEVVAVERLITYVQELPVLVLHPIFVTLRDVDYA